jgi:peptidase M23-like protein
MIKFALQVEVVMKKTGILLFALLIASIGMSCSHSSDDGGGVTVTPIRSSWPVVREASGQWVVLGEVVLRNLTAGTVSIRSITLNVTDSSGAPVQKTYDATQFRNMLLIYRRNVDGTYTNTEPVGSSDMAANSLGYGFVAVRTGGTSQPAQASVTVAFVDGTSQNTDIPLSSFDPGQQMSWPLRTVTGDWVAFNTTGGYYHWTTVVAELGQHFISQRFAIDAFKIDAGGNSSNPPHSPNKEDYYAWGQDILSAGSGTVVAVEKNKLDQVVGTEDTQNPVGNYVVIRHAQNLYSVYVHMMNSSATVTVGDQIATGQLLGKVGNSGGTDQPHLHFQFVDDWKSGPDPLKSAMQSQGLPPLFWNAKVNRLASTTLQGFLNPLPATWDDGINANGGTYTMNGNMPLNMDFVTAP